MIILRSRSLIIPNDEYNLGNDYDTNTATRVFQLDRVMEGIDLANLMFKLDLTYADGTSDTLALDSEVTDDKINLTWTVTKNQLHVPGTVVVQIRALNVDGNMKWTSYIGAFFVEASMFGSADYNGKLSEVEQFEVAIKSEKERVQNEKARQDTEAARVLAEEARANAENERWKTFNTNEEIRKSAENTRNTNETQRQEAETQREEWYNIAKSTYESSLASEAAAGTYAAEAKKYRDEAAQIVTPDGLAAKVVGNTKDISELKEDIDNLQEFADYGIFPTQQGISKNINVANTAKIVTDSHSGSKIEMLAYCNKSQSGTPTPTNQAVIPFAEKIKISIQSGNLASHYIKLTDKIIASNKDYRSKGVIKILPNVPYLLSMCADKGYSDGLIYIFNSDMSVVTTFNLSYAENYKTCSFVAPENAAYMSYYSAVGRVDYSKPCLTIGYKYTGYIENCVDKEIEVQEVFGKIKEIKDTIESKQGRIVKVKRTHYQKVPIEKVTKSNFSNRFLISGSELDYLPKTESSASNCILSNFFAPTNKPYANDNCITIESNNNISFGYDSSKSVDEFKEYFTNHPLYIMYPLKEEVVTFIANNDIELSESAAIYCDENLDMKYFYSGDEYKKGVNITLDSSISFDELKEIINGCVKRGVNAFALMTSDTFESNTSSVIKPIKEGVLDKLEKTIKYINLLGCFVTLRCACHSATNAGGENVTPEDLDTWFTTWENRIKSYLDIAYPLNVRYVAISNELRTLTGDSKYKPYWLRTINNLKGSYPNVKCAINFNIYDKNNLCLDLFDIIGFNCYPCLTRYGLNESDEILKSSFYNDLYNDNSIGKLNELNNLYPNKTIWISEIGTQSQENGLFQTWENYYSPNIENQAVQSKYYELFFTMVDRVKNSGMFIWSVYDARDNGFTFLNKSAAAIVNKYWNNGMEVM
jgi:hypothetical protein